MKCCVLKTAFNAKKMRAPASEAWKGLFKTQNWGFFRYESHGKRPNIGSSTIRLALVTPGARSALRKFGDWSSVEGSHRPPPVGVEVKVKFSWRSSYVYRCQVKSLVIWAFAGRQEMKARSSRRFPSKSASRYWHIFAATAYPTPC